MKTPCCNSTYTRKSKLRYTCDKCGDYVTMYVILSQLEKFKKK